MLHDYVVEASETSPNIPLSELIFAPIRKSVQEQSFNIFQEIFKRVVKIGAGTIAQNIDGYEGVFKQVSLRALIEFDSVLILDEGEFGRRLLM